MTCCTSIVFIWVVINIGNAIYWGFREGGFSKSIGLGLTSASLIFLVWLFRALTAIAQAESLFRAQLPRLPVIALLAVFAGVSMLVVAFQLMRVATYRPPTQRFDPQRQMTHLQQTKRQRRRTIDQTVADALQQMREATDHQVAQTKQELEELERDE